MKKILFIIVCLCAFGGTAEAQLAAGQEKFLGNIISRSIPDDFTKYWNQVTPENAGKWGVVEAQRDQMNWEGLKLAYEFAKKNKLPFKQHTFIWDQQKPRWMDSLNASEQLEEVEEWMQAYAQNFPETDMIDVVNEPLHAAPTFKDALGGKGTTGWDWVLWAFRKARVYFPKSKLILNDYHILSSDSATQVYLGIIQLLKTEKLIDGIGLQGHFMEKTEISTIQGNLDKLHATGLPIYISEFDVHIANDQEQATKFEALFETLWEHPGVSGITLWGYQQGRIWRKDAYLVKSDGTQRPALVWLEGYLKR